jgi:hypothetical protein
MPQGVGERDGRDVRTRTGDTQESHRRCGTGPAGAPDDPQMTAAELAARLGRVRRLRGGNYSARCPAHPDHSPSLTFRDGAHGVLAKCWAGCDVEEIARALNLHVSDLFFEPRQRTARPARPPRPQDEWRSAWTDTLRRAFEQGRFLAAWEPIFAHNDFVRHANRAAAAARARATRMRCDDATMWDEAELAVWFEDEAREVESEADHLVATA